MYEVVVRMKDIGKTDNLNEALKMFLDAMVGLVNDKSICSWQILETTCWIKGKALLWDFYSARDYAIDNGFSFIEGKWNSPAPVKPQKMGDRWWSNYYSTGQDD